MKVFDLIILGGGPAGYMAALHGAQKGLNIAIVEAVRLGGTCLNRGCIPTKALVEAAELWASADKAKQFGLNIEKIKIDFPALIDYKNKTVSNLCKGVEQLLTHNKVEIFTSRGEVTNVTSPKEVTLEDGRILASENLLIATGSSVFLPPIKGLVAEEIHTSDSILDLKELPKSMIIIGAGVIGLEIASIFNKLGTEVTVVEMMDQVLPGLEQEIAQRLRIFLKKRGINIETGAKVTEITGKSGQGVNLSFLQKDKEKEVSGDYLLVAAGRKANMDGLDKYFTSKLLEVNEYLETEYAGIYAAGDVIGGYQLAHVGYHEGITAVENILGQKKKMDYTAVPACIFTEPQVATTGRSTRELEEEGIRFQSFKFPYSALGKAAATSDIEGMVKILTDEEGRYLLGMHIVGRDATELIHHGVMAIQTKTPVEELTKLIFAHPTYGEGLGEAYQMAYGNYYHAMKR